MSDFWLFGSCVEPSSSSSSLSSKIEFILFRPAFTHTRAHKTHGVKSMVNALHRENNMLFIFVCKCNQQTLHQNKWKMDTSAMCMDGPVNACKVYLSFISIQTDAHSHRTHRCVCWVLCSCVRWWCTAILWLAAFILRVPISVWFQFTARVHTTQYTYYTLYTTNIYEFYCTFVLLINLLCIVWKLPVPTHAQLKSQNCKVTMNPKKCLYTCAVYVWIHHFIKRSKYIYIYIRRSCIYRLKNKQIEKHFWLALRL